MIETVLLDLGNVLVPFDFGRGLQAFAELTGLEVAALKRVFHEAKLDAIASGALHPDAFFAELEQLSGRPLDPARARHAWCDIFTPDAEMIALADALAAGWPTFLWSNTDAVHREHLWPLLPCLQRFRGLHLSYELGAAKPHAAFFERALATGGIDPRRAVFVDDIAANLEAAAKFGIATVHHRSAAGTRAALAALGVVP